MDTGPSSIAEAIVAVFIPPACREEVLGDLHERFRSTPQYTADALRTVPLVIISRMRRTEDAQILLIKGFALYMSFFGAAWLLDRAIPCEPGTMVRLAIPATMAMLGLIFGDVYANPEARSTWNLARGSLAGLVPALATQTAFWIAGSDLALPRWIAFYGCAFALLFSSAVRILFPTAILPAPGANAPALVCQNGIARVLKGLSGKAILILLLAVLVVAWQISKRV